MKATYSILFTTPEQQEAQWFETYTYSLEDATAELYEEHGEDVKIIRHEEEHETPCDANEQIKEIQASQRY